MTGERSIGGLARASGIYLAGGMAQQAVGFLLLPLYLSVLSPAEYGTLEIMTTTGSILVMVLTLGLPSAIVKCYHRDCRADHHRQSLLMTGLAIILPVLLLASMALIGGAGRVAEWLVGDAEARRLIVPLAVWVFLAGTSQVVMALFRTREEAGVLTALGLAAVAAAVILNIGFVSVLGWGVFGILWGNAISTACLLAAAAPLLRRRIRLAVEPELARPLLAFGLLVVPAAVAGWVMSISNRYILAYYGQLSTVGIYGLGYKLGMVLEVLIVAPFQLAWPAFAFAISHRPDHKKTYARTLTYLMVAGGLVLLALTHLSRPLLQLIGRSDYIQAHTLVPVVALACLFNGVHYCVSPGIHLAHRSKLLPMLIAGAAALNLGLNFMWIPSFGITGAAWATTVAFGALALATLVVSNSVHPVVYEYARLARIAVAGAGAYLCGHLAQGHGLAATAAIGVAAVVAFPVFLVALGFLDANERRFLGENIPWLFRGRIRKPASPLNRTGETCGPVEI